MPDTDAARLTAVQTAIDAVLASISSGEYMTSYSIQGRMWRGETASELLGTLRHAEQRLLYKIAHASMTGGAIAVARFENEPQ